LLWGNALIPPQAHKPSDFIEKALLVLSGAPELTASLIIRELKRRENIEKTIQTISLGIEGE
tara:strand:- start:578 stop:763 length:186 start_codon:yes stop_codon:yes gene_type:complete